MRLMTLGQMFGMYYPERRMGDHQTAALFQFLYQNTVTSTENCCQLFIPIRQHSDLTYGDVDYCHLYCSKSKMLNCYVVYM